MRLLEPLRLIVDPVFLDLDRVPDERPLLFVGNHTIYGVIDVPFLVHELYSKRGITVRGLGDHFHFRVPVWRDLLTRGGAVDGTPENCAALMRAGQAILVYPGGGREVARRKNEPYKLVWKERLGFARLAIAHGCTIVPFGAVGVEHALDILVDANDILRTPLGALLRRTGMRTDVIMPLARGLGPTPLPRPERFYFGFGEPVPTRHYGGEASDDAAREVRDRVRAAVEDRIDALLAYRRDDPRRLLGPRLASAGRALGGTVFGRRRS
jgi:1-acyl-sn-glycerol-3-phosphate acyltransferase